jgi:hypothetical protein
MKASGGQFSGVSITGLLTNRVNHVNAAFAQMNAASA